MCKKHTMANGKSTNGQIMNWKIQHRRFNIEPRTALKTNNYLQNTTQKAKRQSNTNCTKNKQLPTKYYTESKRQSNTNCSKNKQLPTKYYTERKRQSNTNCSKNKQLPTKYYTESKRQSNTNCSKNRGEFRLVFSLLVQS
jgi:hypothetical protein